MSDEFERLFNTISNPIEGGFFFYFLFLVAVNIRFQTKFFL